MNVTSLLYPFTTFSFAYPWVLAAPLVIFSLLVVRRRATEGALHGSVSTLRSLPTSLRARLRSVVLPVLAALFIIALSLAAARPQKVSYLRNPIEGRNIMLVLDISPSMGTQDFKEGSRFMNRLEAVKEVVSEFLTERKDDRVGLAVFGKAAFLQSPLTLDHELLAQLVQRLQVGLVGDGTAMGDGLGVALKLMEDLKHGSRAIILLTDGVSNAGQVNPIKAAKVAHNLGIKVHTVGIGTEGTQILSVPGGIFSSQKRVKAEYDEETLRSIAEITGGVFFNASTVEGLQKVYKEIDRLERTAQQEPARRLVEELYVPYLSAAFLFFLLYCLLTHSIWMRIP